MTSEPDLTICVDGSKLIRRAADGPLLVGRAPLIAGLTVNHPGISRLHLWLHPGPRWTLVDYESRNGVYVAGRRIAREVTITEGLTVHLAGPAGVAMTFHYTAPCHCADPPPLGHARRVVPDVSHTA